MVQDFSRIGKEGQGDGLFARYNHFMYTSNEAKKLLSYVLADNHKLLEREPQDSAAYKFLESLGVVGAKQVERHSGEGDTFDERGNVLREIELAKSFDATKPAVRSGTLMHTFNSASMRGSRDVSPEMQRNADFLSKLSDVARARTQFDSLQELLGATCPDWSQQPIHKPQQEQRLSQEIKSGPGVFIA